MSLNKNSLRMTHIYYFCFSHGNLRTEAFVVISNPIALLIVGDEKKSIYWNDIFCQALVEENYFAVCFDQRDTGLSTHINVHLTLYGLLNVAKDVMHILCLYGKAKAHFIGSSRGVSLVQMRALSIFEKILTLVLFIKTHDVRSITHKRYDVNINEITPLCIIHNQFSPMAPNRVTNTVQKLRLTNGTAPADKIKGLCNDTQI